MRLVGERLGAKSKIINEGGLSSLQILINQTACQHTLIISDTKDL